MPDKRLCAGCGESYWHPGQRWHHESCSALDKVTEEVKALEKPQDEVLRTAPRAKPRSERAVANLVANKTVANAEAERVKRWRAANREKYNARERSRMRANRAAKRVPA